LQVCNQLNRANSRRGFAGTAPDYPALRPSSDPGGVCVAMIFGLVGSLPQTTSGYFEEPPDFEVMRRPAAAGGPDDADARV